MSDGSSGVLNAAYARARRSSPALKFRYRTRAQLVVDALRRAGPPLAAPRVLDLGAAEGVTLLEIRRLLGARGTFHGVEFASELIAEAPELPDDTKLFEGDVMSLPPAIETGSYDVCSALAVLEHLPDPVACAREACRALRPGGVFVASCPNPTWDSVAGAVGLLDEDAHEQHLDGPGMEAICRQAGLELIESIPFMWAPIGAIAYLRPPVSPRRGLAIDALIRRVPLLRLAFVNHAVVARRPPR